MKFCFRTIRLVLISLALGVLIPQSALQAESAPAMMQSVTGQLSSPEQIARYIFRNFSYETDRDQFGKDDKWQTPEELLSSRKGDCEDFAFFAAEILKANGISSLLINIYGSNFAHTVCVFKENGKYHVIDGKEVIRYNAQSLDELFTMIYPHWNQAALVGFSSNGNCGQVLKVFDKK